MASPERHTHWRYIILDDCLNAAAQQDGPRWFKADLLKELNRQMREIHGQIKPMAMRTLEKDLVDLEVHFGVQVMRSREKGRVHFHYSSDSVSIQQAQLHASERRQLKGILDSLNRFRSLPDWNWWTWSEIMIRGQLGLFPGPVRGKEALSRLSALEMARDAQRWMMPMAEALHAQRPLRLTHAPGLGEKSERTSMLPECMAVQTHGVFVMGRGWDPEAQDWFHWIVDLNEITGLDDVAVEWPESDAESESLQTSARMWRQYLAYRMGIRSGVVDLKDLDAEPEVIRVWAAESLAMRFLKSPMHGSQDMRVEEAASGVIFSLQLVADASFVQFALQWGRDFQVLEPAHLRMVMREETKAISDQYTPMFGP